LIKEATLKTRFKNYVIALAVTGMFFITLPQAAYAFGPDDTLGSICLFAGNFPPKNWAICDGSLISINQNCALFSLLGTMYGGDGRVTFALPDLRGRVPVHFGAGPGLNNDYTIGDTGGSETVSLANSQVQLQVSTAAIDSSLLSGLTDPAIIVTNPSSVSGAQNLQLGGSAPHENMQPYLALNYIICLYGIYPSRDW
jgi:microcystin-dependent protein